MTTTSTELVAPTTSYSLILMSLRTEGRDKQIPNVSETNYRGTESGKPTSCSVRSRWTLIDDLGRRSVVEEGRRRVGSPRRDLYPVTTAHPYVGKHKQKPQPKPPEPVPNRRKKL